MTVQKGCEVTGAQRPLRWRWAEIKAKKKNCYQRDKVANKWRPFNGPENDLTAASPGDVNITLAISAFPL